MPSGVTGNLSLTKHKTALIAVTSGACPECFAYQQKTTAMAQSGIVLWSLAAR